MKAREEQERKCEILKMEFQRAKQVRNHQKVKICTFVYYQINNENLKNEVKNAERREEIIKQVQQENQSKSSIYSEGISQFFFCNKKKVVDKLMTLGRQRLALMLDSLTQPGRRIDRSQTFSDHPHRPVSFVKIKNSPNIVSKYTA